MGQDRGNAIEVSARKTSIGLYRRNPTSFNQDALARGALGRAGEGNAEGSPTGLKHSDRGRINRMHQRPSELCCGEQHDVKDAARMSCRRCSLRQQSSGIAADNCEQYRDESARYFANDGRGAQSRLPRSFTSETGHDHDERNENPGTRRMISAKMSSSVRPLFRGRHQTGRRQDRQSATTV